MARHNLVIAAVGDDSCHPLWIKSSDRNFDLMLIYFGGEKDKYRLEADQYMQTKGLFKYENISAAIERFSELIRRYRAVWLPDDDNLCDTRTINRLFDLFRAYGLGLAQPSILPGSQISHAIVLQNVFCKLRYVNFIEMMCPLFTIEALFKVAHTFSLNRSGWGIDMLWPRFLESEKIAIIDQIGIYHKYRQKKYEARREDYYKNLAHYGIDPKVEQDALVREHRLDTRKIEYHRLQKPLWLQAANLPNAAWSISKHWTTKAGEKLSQGGFSHLLKSISRHWSCKKGPSS